MQITDSDREWVASVAERAVTDAEVREFIQQLNDYADSLECGPDLYRDVDYWQ